jgi:uncharacterized membrane protein
MSYYEALVFLHVAGAVVWVGGGVMLLIMGTRFDRVGDEASLKGLFDQASWFSNRIFIPVSLIVLVLGILAVIEGPWTFGQLWVLLGLAGFAATFLTGLLLIKPEAEAIGATIARDGGMTEESVAGMRRMFLKMRLDYAVFFVVIADMVLKPTGDDVGILVGMAVALAVVAALVVRRLSEPAAAAAKQLA